MTIAQLVTWFIIGLLAGYLVAALTNRPRSGAALFEVLGLGLVGALLGGFIFNFLEILPSLDAISISLRDVLSAVVGALLLLVGVAIARKRAT